MRIGVAHSSQRASRSPTLRTHAPTPRSCRPDLAFCCRPRVGWASPSSRSPAGRWSTHGPTRPPRRCSCASGRSCRRSRAQAALQARPCRCAGTCARVDSKAAGGSTRGGGWHGGGWHGLHAHRTLWPFHVQVPSLMSCQREGTSEGAGEGSSTARARPAALAGPLRTAATPRGAGWAVSIARALGARGRCGWRSALGRNAAVGARCGWRAHRLVWRQHPRTRLLLASAQSWSPADSQPHSAERAGSRTSVPPRHHVCLSAV